MIRHVIRGWVKEKEKKEKGPREKLLSPSEKGRKGRKGFFDR